MKARVCTGQTSKPLRTSVHYSFIILIVIVLITAGIVYSGTVFYKGIENRVEALRGSASMLDSTISNPSDERAGIDYWISRGLNYSQLLNNEIMFASTFSDVNQSNFYTLQHYMQGYTYQCADIADLAFSTAKDLAQQEQSLRDKGIDTTGTSFREIYSVIAKLENTTQQMKRTFTELTDSAKAASTGALAEMDSLRVKGIELTNYYFQAHALVKAAIATLPAGDVNILAPVFLITVLYSVFILFPWVLLLLFFLRKRNRLLDSKVALFARFQLEGAERIEQRAFRISEYIVSAIILTAINATLFYYFFYPNASAGLAQLISNGGGISAFADYLVQNATPITFGFIGAYFFIIQMLLRRYFADDLNPNAYSYTIVRVLTVFILSVLLQIAGSTLGWLRLTASVVAFVVGIFPVVGVRWIMRWANGLAKGLDAPEFIDRYPLTEIDGLNTWHEARLLEEKVENVQNLATASLSDLVIDTNFCSQQLVDWVNQALLLVNTRDRWKEMFQSVGIRTATDLLFNTLDSNCKDIDEERVKTLVEAINSTSNRIPNAETPTGKVAWAVADFRKSFNKTCSLAMETNSLLVSLQSEEPEELDLIVATRKKIDQLAISVGNLKNSVDSALAQNIEGLSNGNNDFTTQIRTALSEAKKLLEECSNHFDVVEKLSSTLDRKQPITLEQIRTVSEETNILCTILFRIEGQTLSILKIIDVAKYGEENRLGWEQLKSKMESVQANGQNALLEAKDVGKNLASLDKDRPETLNRVKALQALTSKLLQAVSASKISLENVGGNFEVLPIPQFEFKAIRDCLDSTGDTIGQLLKLTTDVRDLAECMDIDKPETMFALKNLEELSDAVKENTDKARTQSDAVFESLASLTFPAIISRETLVTLVIATRQGLNTKFIINYYTEESKATESPVSEKREKTTTV